MPFRPDIEGLRALAVLFVLIWHAGVPWLPGGFIGVDVFFVVSGFLMTSILHREQIASRRGMVNVGEFYARRARRLVPASLLTLIATAIATFVILPETRWRDIGFDIAAAGGYLVNWRLADRAVDYLQQDAAASPIQHFWSLSVEEQFYVFWPLLLVGIAVLVRLIRFSITKATFAGLALIAVASLAWSSYLTDAEPGRAYFVTTTRLWELAIGGLVALALPSLAKLPMSIAAAFAWIGLASIVGTGFLLTTTVPFPGMVALIPTVGAALVIASGPAAGPYGPIRMCTNRLVLWIGGCSYSIYLWHWPFIVIGGYWVTEGLRETSVTEGVGLALLSVLPAWLSLRFVENPLRRSEELIESVRKSLTLAFLGIAVSLVAGLLLASLTPRPAPTNYISKYVPPPGVEKEPFGAEVLGDNPVESPAALVGAIDVISPSPQAAPDDNPAIYLDGCHLSFEETEPRFCDYGDLSSSVEVAVVGDSHAAQWLPALQSVALDRAWKLKVSTKSSCPYLGIAVLSNTGRPCWPSFGMTTMG
ncbi:acyltransferase family protein [Mycobacterium sp. smrl_JER01]|uniref:acyltransferase family protein n=1 Tax=Mycobacterium sp. smrl_JER01 TaxID=3402633 RepID=UPI003ABFCA45